MKILTAWLRAYLPSIPVSDRQLADDLTLRGIAVEGVHALGDGHLFEMDITTNRVDAMNHYGIAREAATIYGLALPPLDITLPPAREAAAFPVQIEPEAAMLCGRFTARVLRNVTVQPSTGETARLFDLLGQKAISNAVDASNFTLLGMGHPTHAFDLDRIEGGLVVRQARRGETLRLLDGTSRTLEPDDLVIADERKPLSLAGVMGGWESMITPATRNVLIEAAWFDPASIRRSGRRHGLHTDASHRFERGADFNAAPVANALVAQQILAHGGELHGPLVDLVTPEIASRTAARPPVELSTREVGRHLGATLDDSAAGVSALGPELIRSILSSLGCELKSADRAAVLDPTTGSGEDTRYSVHLPSWRLDLEREIDLIEEIARVFGYDRFRNTLPSPLPVTARPAAPRLHALRTRLLALGFSEAISSTFTSASDAAFFAAETTSSPGQGAARQVALENPLSEEVSLMRPSLLPGMAAMLANNLHRDVPEVRLFEPGETFHLSQDLSGDVDETASLSLGLTTATAARTALFSAADAPIFALKGVVESIVSLFTLPGGAESLHFSTGGEPAWLEPGRCGTALLHGRTFAHFGELARAEQIRRKLRQPVYLASIAVAELLELPLRTHTARELSRFQAVERDFSFVFPDHVQWHAVAAAIHALALPELERLEPLEIFRDAKGKAIPAGQHSLLLRTVFQSPSRTLTESDLTEASARIVGALTALGGTQRA